MTKYSYDKEFKEQAVQYYLDNKDHMTMKKYKGRPSPQDTSSNCKRVCQGVAYNSLKSCHFKK